MNKRPARLPLTATLVIWGSTELSANEKIVWYHFWLLDTSLPDGCYMSSRSLGERLGLSPKTIESIRARLQALGLAVFFKRSDGPSATEAQPGWVATLWPELVPKSRDMRTACRESPALSRSLDDEVRNYDAGFRSPAEHPSVPERKPHPRSSGGRFRQIAEVLSDNGRSLSTAGGVGGGSLPQSGIGESQLPPAVRERQRQKGVGSHEPELQGEGDREPSVAERREIAELDRAEAEDARRAGWAKIRAARADR